VHPDDVIALPGVTRLAVNTNINPTFQLCTGAPTQVPYQLPATLYPSSLSCTETTGNTGVRVAYGLAPSAAGNSIVQTIVAIAPYLDGGLMNIIPADSAAYSDQSGLIYQMNFCYGPASLSVVLFVLMSTTDSGTTPVFTGAYFENIY
jgi:hypothetical protein